MMRAAKLLTMARTPVEVARADAQLKVESAAALAAGDIDLVLGIEYALAVTWRILPTYPEGEAPPPWWRVFRQ